MASVDGALIAGQDVAVDRHIAGCATCRELAADVRAVSGYLARWKVETAPAGIVDTIKGAVRPHRALPNGPDARPHVPFWSRYRWQIAVAAVVALVIGIQVSVCGSTPCWSSGSSITSPSADYVTAAFDAWWQTRPRVDLGIPSDGAKVTVVWFVDYECPSCATADPVYSTLFQQQAASSSGAIRFLVRDWPWDATCNSAVTQTIRGHEAACAAAVAMNLAQAHGTSDAMKTWLFAHQGSTTDDVGRAAAQVAGISDFSLRYAAELQTLRSRVAALASSGINATPSCYINGVRAAGADGQLLTPEQMARALQLELRRPTRNR